MFRSTSEFGSTAHDKHHALLMGEVDDVGVRLSLDPLRSVPIADQSAKTRIYVVPHKHAFIPLFDGKRFVPREVPYDYTGESTQAIRRVLFVDLDATNHANATSHDVFAKWSNGKILLKTWKWRSSTTRSPSTANFPHITPDHLGLFRGRLVQGVISQASNAAPPAIDPHWRYLGTFYTSAAGQTTDSDATRFVWNCYNRVPRKLYRHDSTTSWNYTTATWRQARATTDNRVQYVCGRNEDPVYVMVKVWNTNAGNINTAAGVGVDSTTVNSADIHWGVTQGNGFIQGAYYQGQPGLGYHALNWLEISDASGTTTWYGAFGAGIGGAGKSGMLGTVYA